VVRKDLVSDWSCGDGFVGYAPVIECRSVQEERPRASTSGGQSAGREGAVCVVVGVAAGVRFLGILPDMAKREATSLQARHL
jgi:hypothetical protein